MSHHGREVTPEAKAARRDPYQALADAVRHSVNQTWGQTQKPPSLASVARQFGMPYNSMRAFLTQHVPERDSLFGRVVAPLFRNVGVDTVLRAAGRMSDERVGAPGIAPEMTTTVDSFLFTQNLIDNLSPPVGARGFWLVLDDTSGRHYGRTDMQPLEETTLQDYISAAEYNPGDIARVIWWTPFGE